MPYRVVFADEGLGSLSGIATTLPGGLALGDVRYNETGTKKYRLFYNAGGASIPTSRVFQRSFGGTGPYSITVTTTTETGCTAAAGMNDTGVTITTGAYFWGCVWGHPVTLVPATVSIATDAGVCMEGTGGAGLVMLATTPSFNCFGMNLGDLSTTTTGQATANTLLAGGRFFVAFEDVPAWFRNKICK